MQGHYDDGTLLAEMHKRVRSGMKVHTAALAVAEKATGGGTLESKARRLSGKYKKVHIHPQDLHGDYTKTTK
jgi:hypothetical protein